jgi:hypothetical protein
MSYCARCNYWIHPGYEVLYKEAYYHDHCAVQEAKEAREQKAVKRKKRSHLRLVKS